MYYKLIIMVCLLFNTSWLKAEVYRCGGHVFVYQDSPCEGAVFQKIVPTSGNIIQSRGHPTSTIDYGGPQIDHNGGVIVRPEFKLSPPAQDYRRGHQGYWRREQRQDDILWRRNFENHYRHK